MNTWSMERWAASTGVGFVILLLVGNLMPGSPAKWNASAIDIQQYLQGKHKELIVGAILLGLGYVLFLWFLSSFAGMFREAGQGRLATIVYGAGVTTVAIAAVGDGLMLALTKITYTADPKTVAAIYGASTWMYSRFFWPAAALALATCLATRRSKVMPDWYAWLSLAGAVLFVIGGISMKNSGFFSITGGMGLIGFLAFAVWIAVSSLLLMQRTESAPVARPALN
ncbi:MAG: hypothetical protein JOZ56_03250 [Actinobacteria bacterium]|nr:hypothetical protein [Actinomycetota bacterium]